MVRSSWNRWLVVVMTLCLVTASLSLLNAPASASALFGSSHLANPGDPTSSTVANAGDPDVPMGPGDGRTGVTAKSFGRTGVVCRVSSREVGRAGDALTLDNVVMTNVRLMLLSLRGFYLGF